MNYFFVPEDKYFEAYNDYEFIFHTKKQQGYDYVDVHMFYVGFKKHFPTYGIQYELNEEGSNLFYIKSTVNNPELLHIQKTKALEDLEKVDSKDWKNKKKLENKIDELNNELTYGYRGVVVKPYVIDLETGNRTPAIDYPLMLTNMNSVINPDSRDVTDGLARAEVKCGGRYCGYCYRLFTREGIGTDLENSQMVKAIKAIVERCEKLNIPVPDNVHFGTNYSTLRSLALQLRDQVAKLPKED